MKWNWGTGIFIFIVLFTGACIAFLIWTRTQVWSLVEEDYYPKELRWEEKLGKMRNANALTVPLQVKVEQTDLVISFPELFRGKVMTGTIDVYRPSDEKLDLILPIGVDTALGQHIPLSRLKKGRYVVKIDWTSGGRGFYKEQDIFVP